MRFRCCLLASVILVSSVVVPARAGQSRIIGDPSRDVRQTMQARKLLAEDPDLAAWNIGVMVTDRVAVLWGPVPSAEIAFRAELCLKTMFELVEVRNELSVSESLEPVNRPLKIDSPPRYMPELLPPKLPEEPRSKPAPSGVLMGQARKASAQTTSASKKPPEPLAMPKQEGADADRALTVSIRTFLQSKTTYSAVEFAVQDGRVYLRVTNQDSDVLHEAARSIARLPNVGGVILSENGPPR